MQDTLFALIQARIIQTALNGDLNLFRVGADISACRPTVSARCTAIFRWLAIPFRAAAGFRRILTRAEIAKQIIDAFCGGRFFGSRFLLSVRRCFRRRGIRFLLRLRRRFRRLGIRFLLSVRRCFRRFGSAFFFASAAAFAASALLSSSRPPLLSPLRLPLSSSRPLPLLPPRPLLSSSRPPPLSPPRPPLFLRVRRRFRRFFGLLLLLLRQFCCFFSLLLLLLSR
ncbi:hypothetical protein SEEHRA23_24385 [Salmonella enterica subsp. enterica serovar Heidelberg str. SARA33]|nr:hypothetical protein SEEHRA23_24385 [Salmonella enterica subsp. enterica serovar Heidelberg str. SARA33]